jgi:DNA-binding transcriptional LysR family regulator
MLVVPAGHPLADRTELSFADALEFDLITMVQGTAIRGWALAAAARMSRKPKFAMEVQSYEAARAMVKAGFGISIMPATNIMPYEGFLQVSVLPLTDDWAHMQLYLVCDRTAVAVPAIEKLLAHLTSG